MFEAIENMLINGNWKDAIKEYQAINPSGREVGDYLNSLEDMEILRDMALLGFYAREYNPDDREY